MSRFISLLLLFCTMTGWSQEILLSTHWTQDPPYNMLCPRDPANDYSYSYAGCPAVAMGQIINYLQTTQSTRFSDDDDYMHIYAGRNFSIDDDWEELQFPSFPQLNVMLDSVDAFFQRGEELSDPLAAALIFACGTAMKQVYSAQGSGTFSVDQAYEAYQRFGFSDCMLLREPDSAMYALLISNLQAGYPAHLAVETPDATAGHNVVVDGYRESDGKFHLNFGYGGYMDDWYDIPDPIVLFGGLAGLAFVFIDELIGKDLTKKLSFIAGGVIVLGAVMMLLTGAIYRGMNADGLGIKYFQLGVGPIVFAILAMIAGVANAAAPILEDKGL